MIDKNTDYASAVEGLAVQLQHAQQLIMALQKAHGNEETIRMINTMMSEMAPAQARLLSTLVTAMQAEAMGDAGSVIH